MGPHVVGVDDDFLSNAVASTTATKRPKWQAKPSASGRQTGAA
jgi:hypothetical protein